MNPAQATVTAFLARWEAVAGSWQCVESRGRVPEAVEAYCASLGGATVAVAPALADLPWGEAATAYRFGGSSGAERVGVSEADSAIAETGTLVLRSGADHPVTLNFLPEHHVVLLEVARLVPTPEAAWERMLAAGPLPRAVNWITGPSRTADVEQTLQLGAHGPRAVHVLLIGGNGLDTEKADA